MPFSFMLIALSIGVLLRYAPVEYKNKPLEEFIGREVLETLLD